MPDMGIGFIVFAIFAIVIVRYVWKRLRGEASGGAGDSMPDGDGGDGGGDGGGGGGNGGGD